MNLGKIQIAVLFLILANIIWGASFPIYKWSLGNIPPFTFVFLRFYIGALLILPFVIKNIWIRRQDLPILFTAALFAITLQIPLMIIGLKLTPSINAPIIIASGPIIIIIASVLFLKENLKLKVVSGTLISFLGVLLIMISPLLEKGAAGGGIFGNFLIFLGTLCGAIAVILIKKLTKYNYPLTIMFWIFLLGSLPLLPFVFFESQTFNIWNNLNIQGLIGLLYGIIFASVIAHYFQIYGLKLIKASDVGVYAYVDPLATIIVAIPLLGETLTPIYLVASIFVFLGIFIAEGRIPYHPIHKLFNNNNI